MSSGPYYPVMLDVRERRCVVLGDTPIAMEKADGLRTAGATVLHHLRPFEVGDFIGAFLAIDGSGDSRSHENARAEADRERVLLNVVDVAPHCDWIAPAVVRRGPLQVAISTSGESPFLARTLRERVEMMLGEEWGPFTQLLGRTRRRLRRAGIPGAVQQRIYRHLLRSQILAILRDGQPEPAQTLALAIEQRARRESDGASMGEVVLAGAGPGDPELLTIATRRVLADADMVLHDALVDPQILRLCGAQTRIVDVGKRVGTRSITQSAINEAMVHAARAGHLVVRLKGGDPFLFGRGGEELEAVRQAGIPARVIPGVSAPLAAPAAADIPLTHRGVAGSVGIVTGHRAGGIATDLDRIARSVDTLVVLMPHQLELITARLTSALGSSKPAALISHATTPKQRVLRAPLGQIAGLATSAGIEAPSTLLVGDVVNLQVAARLALEPQRSPG